MQHFLILFGRLPWGLRWKFFVIMAVRFYLIFYLVRKLLNVSQYLQSNLNLMGESKIKVWDVSLVSKLNFVCILISLVISMTMLYQLDWKIQSYIATYRKKFLWCNLHVLQLGKEVRQGLQTEDSNLWFKTITRSNLIN